MFGLGKPKATLHVTATLCLAMVFVHLRTVCSNLICYSSEYQRSVYCEDDRAECLTVCNRNITIQGCSWASCSTLLFSFPHITDCLQCQRNYCNREACTEGRISNIIEQKKNENEERMSKRVEQNQNQKMVKSRNITRYKLLWPDTIDYDVSRERVIKYGALAGTRLPKSTPSPTTTQMITITTATTSISTTTIAEDVTTAGKDVDKPDNEKSCEEQMGDKDNEREFNMDLDKINTLEKILMALLLLTLLALFLLTCCWIHLSRACSCEKPSCCADNSLLCDIIEDDMVEIRIRNPCQIQNRVTVNEDNNMYDNELVQDYKLGDMDETYCGRMENIDNKHETLVKVKPEHSSKTDFGDAPETKNPFTIKNNSDTKRPCVHAVDLLLPDPKIAAADGLLTRSLKCLMIPAYYIKGLSLSALQMVLTSSNIQAIQEKQEASSSGARCRCIQSGRSITPYQYSTSHRNKSGKSSRSHQAPINETDSEPYDPNIRDRGARYKHGFCETFQ